MKAGPIASALAVVVGLGAAGLVCQRVAARRRYAVPLSTMGAGAEGTRALWLLAAQVGSEPVAWVRDLTGLPEGGMLVVLGGCEAGLLRPVSRYEREAVQAWVGRGGVLLVAGAAEYLWPALGVVLKRPPLQCLKLGDHDDRRDDGHTDEPLDIDELSELLMRDEALPPAELAEPMAPFLAGLEPIAMRQPASITVTRTATTLLRTPGGVVGVEVPQGEGRIVVLGSASPFQNRELASAEGGVLFARLIEEYAPEGPVLFDEYHLGVGRSRSLVSYLRDVGGGPLMIQLLVVVALLLWRVSHRFGGVRLEPPPGAASAESHARTIGELYARAADPKGADALLVRRGLTRVADHHHLPHADAQALAKRLDERGRSDAASATRALGSTQDTALHRRDLVKRARRIDQLVRRATAQEEM